MGLLDLAIIMVALAVFAAVVLSDRPPPPELTPSTLVPALYVQSGWEVLVGGSTSGDGWPAHHGLDAMRVGDVWPAGYGELWFWFGSGPGGFTYTLVPEDALIRARPDLRRAGSRAW